MTKNSTSNKRIRWLLWLKRTSCDNFISIKANAKTITNRTIRNINGTTLFNTVDIKKTNESKIHIIMNVIGSPACMK